MGKPGLITLRMVWPGLDSCSCRHAHHYIGVLLPAIMCFRQIIYNLVKSFGHKVGKLHLDHRFISFNGKSEPGTKYSSLTKWCVSHTRFSKFINKSFCYLKNPTILCDILTH